MRTWDTLYPHVLPEVLGCPEPLVDQHLISAAREFCTVTRCWREDLDRITTRDGRSTYDIFYPTEAEGVTLIGATLDDHDIGLEVADVSMAERRRGNAGPARVRSMDLVTVQLMPTPGEGRILRLEAILQPTEEATGLPDAIAQQYGKFIATGALAALLDLNKQPWTNNPLADKRRGEFELRMARVKSKVWKGYSNTRPRNRAQFF